MQLHALDIKKCLVHAKKAFKQQDYFCLECEGIVRVRSGLHRQTHFYHLENSHPCHLSSKSMTHLQIQQYLVSLFRESECSLEVRFPEISRIADVVWFKRKIIFEIQCSNITAKEVQQRNQDYNKIGYDVVWILHDSRFNRFRLTAAELYLRHSPHYFTNINAEGKGIIYDQFDYCEKGTRHSVMDSLKVDFSFPFSWEKKGFDEFKAPKLIYNRLTCWPYAFQGDLVYQWHKEPHSHYFLQALQIENKYYKEEDSSSKTAFSFLGNFFSRYFLRPYKLLLQMLLEKLCR